MAVILRAWINQPVALANLRPRTSHDTQCRSNCDRRCTPRLRLRPRSRGESTSRSRSDRVSIHRARAWSWSCRTADRHIEWCSCLSCQSVQVKASRFLGSSSTLGMRKRCLRCRSISTLHRGSGQWRVDRSWLVVGLPSRQARSGGQLASILIVVRPGVKIVNG